eukprot:SAG31_NODE_260_length_18915_cov_3.432823_7_plen_647_part_00
MDGGSAYEKFGTQQPEQWWYEKNPQQGLQRMGCCGKPLKHEGNDEPGICASGGGLFGGVVDDYRRRFPHYFKDIREGFHPKTLSAALFMFFATFFSTASLGALIQKITNKRIGLEEYLIMNSIAGMTHALFGCQPLLVLRPTGPITLICTMICKYADFFGFDFYEYLGATGFFVGLYMALVAGTEFCMLIKYLTRFTHDIFAFFVCSIYIHDGVSAVMDGFDDKTEVLFGETLFSTLLAILVFVISMWLNFAITWKAFNDTIRGLLTDYAVTIAVFAVIFISYVFPIEKDHVHRVDVPEKAGPTCHRLNFPINATDRPTDLWPHFNCSDCLCKTVHGCACPNYGPGNTTDIFDALVEEDAVSGDGSGGGYAMGQPRPWIVDYSGTTPQLWLAAAVSALPIVMFFYFDQNLSSLLTQQPYMRLRRGSFYHSSFLAMGVFNFIGPSFGLPFVTGSLPHSPQLVKALTIYKRKKPLLGNAQSEEAETLEATGVAENRIAPFLMYFMIGLPVFLPSLLNKIPLGALNGVLAFVGVAGLLDCQLFERLLCLLRHPSEFHKRYAGLPAAKVHLFTMFQIFFFVAFWVANHFSFFCVPFLIVTAVFTRRFFIPTLFTQEQLDQLDDDGTAVDGEVAPTAADFRSATLRNRPTD